MIDLAVSDLPNAPSNYHASSSQRPNLVLETLQQWRTSLTSMDASRVPLCG